VREKKKEKKNTKEFFYFVCWDIQNIACLITHIFFFFFSFYKEKNKKGVSYAVTLRYTTSNCATISWTKFQIWNFEKLSIFYACSAYHYVLLALSKHNLTKRYKNDTQ
jgi:hypothetical protein